MKLTEYIESLDLKLNLEFGNHAGPWIATIKKSSTYVDFKKSQDDIMLRSCAGWGKTPQEAIINLCSGLKEHKFIVIPTIDHNERFVLPLPSIEP